jgi:hypothetical protein
MALTDHGAQLARIDSDGQSLANLQWWGELLHRGGGLVLVIAGGLFILSAFELFENPTPLGAAALIGELIAIAIDLILHLAVHQIRHNVSNQIALLRQELQLKGYELRQFAIDWGLDLQRYCPCSQSKRRCS